VLNHEYGEHKISTRHGCPKQCNAHNLVGVGPSKVTRVIRDAVASAEAYNHHFSDSIKVEVGAMENRVQAKRHHTPSEMISSELSLWILDTGFSRTHESKYMKTINLYWHIKDLIACAMEGRNNMGKAILDGLDALDSNYDHLIKIICGYVNGS